MLFFALPGSESFDLYFLYDLFEKLLYDDFLFLDRDATADPDVAADADLAAIHWLVEVEVELKFKNLFNKIF